jgi:branched-chain amino acid transport system substrate-binding protein
MRQAANLHNLKLGLFLPSIRLNTSPSDYFPVKQAQMRRFDGKESYIPHISGRISP